MDCGAYTEAVYETARRICEIAPRAWTTKAFQIPDADGDWKIVLQFAASLRRPKLVLYCLQFGTPRTVDWVLYTEDEFEMKVWRENTSWRQHISPREVLQGLDGVIMDLRRRAQDLIDKYQKMREELSDIPSLEEREKRGH